MMWITTSRMAMTRYKECEASLVAQPAPNHAPSRLPASRLRTIAQFAAMVEKETVDARNSKADATTTTRLMALSRITACMAANWRAPISRGNRKLWRSHKPAE
jgi:hypothetical protein